VGRVGDGALLLAQPNAASPSAHRVFWSPQVPLVIDGGAAGGCGELWGALSCHGGAAAIEAFHVTLAGVSATDVTTERSEWRGGRAGPLVRPRGVEQKRRTRFRPSAQRQRGSGTPLPLDERRFWIGGPAAGTVAKTRTTASSSRDQQVIWLLSTHSRTSQATVSCRKADTDCRQISRQAPANDGAGTGCSNSSKQGLLDDGRSNCWASANSRCVDQ